MTITFTDPTSPEVYVGVVQLNDDGDLIYITAATTEALVKADIETFLQDNGLGVGEVGITVRPTNVGY